MSKNFKRNRPLFFGILLSGIYFFTKETMAIPDIVQGFLLGAALAGYIAGIYGSYHDISKLREWKKSLLKRL